MKRILISMLALLAVGTSSIPVFASSREQSMPLYLSAIPRRFVVEISNGQFVDIYNLIDQIYDHLEMERSGIRAEFCKYKLNVARDFLENLPEKDDYDWCDKWMIKWCKEQVKKDVIRDDTPEQYSGVYDPSMNLKECDIRYGKGPHEVERKECVVVSSEDGMKMINIDILLNRISIATNVHSCNRPIADKHMDILNEISDRLIKMKEAYLRGERIRVDILEWFVEGIKENEKCVLRESFR